MPATATDLGFYRSSTGDSEAGARSATEMVSGTDNALWPDISDSSRIAGGTRSRKYFVLNEHATDAFADPVIWFSALATGITEDLGVGFDDANDDNIDVGAMTAWSASAIAQIVSDGADTRGITIIGADGSGVAVEEGLTLNGTTAVSGSQSFSKVYAVKASAESASRIVTIKQGAGGTTRGTIPANRICTFLWLTNPTAKANGIKRVDLSASATYGLWRRQTWAPGISAVVPAETVLAVEEA